MEVWQAATTVAHNFPNVVRQMPVSVSIHFSFSYWALQQRFAIGSGYSTLSKCWCCTRQRWAIACSNCRTRPSSSQQICIKISKRQRRRQNCAFKMFVYWISLNLAWCTRLKLKALHRFTSTANAVEDLTAVQEGKLGKGLKKFLTEQVVEKAKRKETLVVVDPKLGALRYMCQYHACHLTLVTSPLHLKKIEYPSHLSFTTRRP